MSAPQWAVGQEVILCDKDGTKKTRTVARVGRKYVYTGAGWAERRFHIGDGIEAGGYGVRARIFTPESLIVHERYKCAQDRLHELTRGYGWMDRLSADALEQIVAIIEKEKLT